MSAYCVGCGKQNLKNFAFRCTDCWAAFKAAGGIKRVDTVQTIGTMRIGKTEWFNYARFCYYCGAKLPKAEDSTRARFALVRGGESHRCDTCYWSQRMEGITPPQK